MINTKSQLSALGLSLLLVSSGAIALPTLSMTTTDPTSYTVGVVNPTMTVNFSVGLESGDDVNDTLVQLTNFVAYDPTVLKYQSHSFGTALDDIGATPVPASTKSLTAVNYTVLGSLDPSITGIGTPDNSTSGSGFIDGSLLFNMVAALGDGGFDIDSLFGQQQFSGTALLFSVVFEVVIDQIGSSSIVFLDGANFAPDLNPALGIDTKTYNGGTPSPFYVQTKNSLTVTVSPVPEPASLALLAAGLLGLAMRRRRLA